MKKNTFGNEEWKGVGLRGLDSFWTNEKRWIRRHTLKGWGEHRTQMERMVFANDKIIVFVFDCFLKYY